MTECIREGILEEFLRKNRAEVIRMSILFDFDEEKYMRMMREEYREEYREKGREEGRKEGRDFIRLYQSRAASNSRHSISPI